MCKWEVSRPPGIDSSEALGVESGPACCGIVERTDAASSYRARVVPSAGIESLGKPVLHAGYLTPWISPNPRVGMMRRDLASSNSTAPLGLSGSISLLVSFAVPSL